MIFTFINESGEASTLNTEEYEGETKLFFEVLIQMVEHYELEIDLSDLENEVLSQQVHYLSLLRQEFKN